MTSVFLIAIILLFHTTNYSALKVNQWKNKVDSSTIRNDLNTNTKILQQQQRSHYHTIVELCDGCIEKSTDKFTSGNDYYSNPKPQMGTWIDQNCFRELALAIENSVPARDSFVRFLTNSPVPVVAKACNSEQYDINLLHIPAMPTELDQGMVVDDQSEERLRYAISPRRHAPGTVLIYKVLLGSVEIISRNKDRIIQTDVIAGNDESILRRIGGPTRTLIGHKGSSALVLEIALNPTSPAESVYVGIGVKVDVNKQLDNNTMCINVPTAQLDSLLLDKSLIQVVESDRSDQKATDRRKYDIYDSLSSSVGGLGSQINDIVRRILLTRRLDPQLVQSLGVGHVKGLLLYGPPGTGKTLIAREIAKALNARPPRIINGPELLDKYIGEAERNIRAVFADAEEEWKLRGTDSELHVVIFDEIDSIAKKRGSLGGDGSGVRDSCVNQLLTKLDGIGEMNNLLVVGMTNRRDLLDPALLRPGRFELQLEIEIPDLYGREEIMAILLRPLVKGDRISVEEALKWIGTVGILTDGWTGADLAGLLRCTTSYALERFFLEVDQLGNVSHSDADIRLRLSDLQQALHEMRKEKRNSFRAKFKNFMRRRYVNRRIKTIQSGARASSNEKDARHAEYLQDLLSYGTKTIQSHPTGSGQIKDSNSSPSSLPQETSIRKEHANGDIKFNRQRWSEDPFDESMMVQI